MNFSFLSRVGFIIVHNDFRLCSKYSLPSSTDELVYLQKMPPMKAPSRVQFLQEEHFLLEVSRGSVSTTIALAMACKGGPYLSVP